MSFRNILETEKLPNGRESSFAPMLPMQMRWQNYSTKPISLQPATPDRTKNPASVMTDFKQKKIRFLCACNMISEGWDYPELGILVMARPTLSKVLYLQQIGRGLRKTDTKKNIIVIDVVDEYGAMIKACNMHTIFANPYYVPFGDIIKTDYTPGDMVVIDGLEERIERIMEVDINLSRKIWRLSQSGTGCQRIFRQYRNRDKLDQKEKNRAKCRIPIRQQIPLPVQSG